MAGHPANPQQALITARVALRLSYRPFERLRRS